MDCGPVQAVVGLDAAAHSDIVPLDVVIGIALLAKVREGHQGEFEFLDEQLVIRSHPGVEAHPIDRNVGAKVEIAAAAPAFADAGSAVGVLGEAAEVGGFGVAVEHFEYVEVLVLTEESDPADIG